MENEKECGIFFCDIQGTLTGDNKNSDGMKLFFENLERIRKKDKIDILYLSLISTLHMEEIKEFAKNVIPYLTPSIQLGPLFSNKHIFVKNERKRFFDGKTQQIFETIKRGNFKKVYYADDMVIFHQIIKCLQFEVVPNNKIEQFVLGMQEDTEEFSNSTSNKGIESLNSVLDNYITGKVRSLNENDNSDER